MQRFQSINQKTSFILIPYQHEKTLEKYAFNFLLNHILNLKIMTICLALYSNN